MCVHIHIHIHYADECSPEHDEGLGLCHYFEYKKPPVVPYPQFVIVGKCIKWVKPITCAFPLYLYVQFSAARYCIVWMRCLCIHVSMRVWHIHSDARIIFRIYFACNSDIFVYVCLACSYWHLRIFYSISLACAFRHYLYMRACQIGV